MNERLVDDADAARIGCRNRGGVTASREPVSSSSGPE